MAAVPFSLFFSDFFFNYNFTNLQLLKFDMLELKQNFHGQCYFLCKLIQ